MRSPSHTQTSRSVSLLMLTASGPLSGDILGMQETVIEVYYRPTTHTTAEAEISFRTTEFDSQSKICRIVGNAMPQKAKTRQESLEKQ